MSVNTMTFEQSAAYLEALYKEVTGQFPTIQIANTKDFTTVGTTLLQGGIDPLAMGLQQILDRTVFAMRLYNKSFEDITVDEIRYGAITRKVNFLDNALDATDDRYPLTDGTSLDPYEIKKSKIYVTNYYGNTLYSDHLTIFRDQLDSAVRDAAMFGEFLGAQMTNITNKHKQVEEAEARGIIANFIAAKYAHDSANAINVLQEYYNETGVTLTPADMFAPANYVEFTRWLAAFMQTLVDKMGERSTKFHMNLTGKEVMRFTKKPDMRKYISDKVLNNIVAVAQSVTYNPEMISNIADGAKKMTFWQNINDPYTVEATPAYLDVATGNVANDTNPVLVENIIGILFDRDALGIVKRHEWSAATPFNPRGGYYNVFYHWEQCTWNSFDENFVLLYAGTVTP